MKKNKTSKNLDSKKSKRKIGKSKKLKSSILEPIKTEILRRPRIIREKKELIHDNPLQANEGLVKSIIDKIINLSVRNSYLNTINRKLENYYFDYMKSQVNNLFATTNIFYYDEPEIEQIDKKELFWNKKYEKSNTWIEISEPNTSKCDRYENAFMNYVNFAYKSSVKLPFIPGGNNVQDLGNQKNRDDKTRPIYKNFNMKISGIKNKESNKKILDILEEKSSISSFEEEIKDNTKNNNNKNKKVDKIKNKTINKISPKKNLNLFLKENKNKENNTNYNINNINAGNRKPKKEPIPEMRYKEIQGIEKEYNHENYDPPNINFLRKEIQEEIIRKEIEERKNTKNKKIINIPKNENIVTNFIDTHTKIKIFDSNKFSFDSNGKIISFKPIKMESLTKDFASLQNEIKSFENKKIMKRTIKSKKNVSQNKNDELTNRNSNKTGTKKEKILKNPEDDPNGINRHNYVKINTEKNAQIIPSGSNFSIMLPNIGVILKEDEQIKEGTREFGKFFKKYSLKDYEKILKDYVPIQNRTMMQNKMNQSMNNINSGRAMSKKISKRNMNNTNSYKTNSFNINNTSIGNNLLLSTQAQNYSNNADISNPLINQANTIQGNDYMNNDYILNNLNSINNSSLIKSIKSNNNQSYNNNSLLNTTPFSFMRNGSFNNLSGFIKLNKNGTSLKNELDSLKDLDDKDNLNFYPGKMQIKTKNLFVGSYKDLNRDKIKKNSSFNNYNEFNKKIILTKGWGTKTMSKNMSTGNLIVSKHHTKYQALRELGSNLLNGIKIKLPRERKVDINI